MKKLIFAAIAAVTLLSACNNGVPKAKLKTDVDSLSYEMGLASSQGLKEIISQQYNVDTAYIDEFLKGVKEGALAGDDKKKAAYLVGIQIGQQISQQMVRGTEQQIFGDDSTRHLSVKNVLAGFIAGVKNKDIIKVNGQQMTPEMAFELVNKKMEQMRSEQMEKRFSKEKKAGEDYVKKYAKQAGVRTLQGGVLYRVITEGNGPLAKATDTVKVTYEGRLADGKVFDSTDQHGGTPVEMVPQGVIPGMGVALTHMPKGSTWEICIPAEMAYGSQNNPVIPPFSPLVFKVTLVDIK